MIWGITLSRGSVWPRGQWQRFRQETLRRTPNDSVVGGNVRSALAGLAHLRCSARNGASAAAGTPAVADRQCRLRTKVLVMGPCQMGQKGTFCVDGQAKWFLLSWTTGDDSSPLLELRDAKLRFLSQMPTALDSWEDMYHIEYM